MGNKRAMGRAVVESYQFDGVSLNIGIGYGQAIVHQSVGATTGYYHKSLKNNSCKNELKKLDQAFVDLVDEIQKLISQEETPRSVKPKTKQLAQSTPESLEILSVYLLLAQDPGWRRQLREQVEKGITAVAAIDRTLQLIHEKLKQEENQSHWQERVRDFEDLSTRLKRHLTEVKMSKRFLAKEEADELPIIIIADHLGPAELLEYDRKRLVGLILAEQSQTSHVAIVARSLDIPIVGGVKDFLTKIRSGDFILLDGDEGRVYIHPTKELLNRYDAPFEFKKTHHFELSESAASLAARTIDNVSVSLFLNAGLVEDVDYIEAAGAEGIGLYRTEIPFMMRSRLPNVDEQAKLYKEILKRAGAYPVVFRTLDVGGDKVLPYLERLKSEASIRQRRTAHVVFDRPILLKYQLRALLRASAGLQLKIMLPMIAEVAEVQAVRELLEGEIAREKEKKKLLPIKIQLGAMIEVPSLVHQLPLLFPHVDFLSVGSNDLFQFFYAIDREHLGLPNRYDVLSPTFLNLLKSIQYQCQAAKIPLSICGEMAGRPLEALALIGIGYRTLSMSAAAVPAVKSMIRSVNCRELSDYIQNICVPSRGSIRQALQDFIGNHQIKCE